MFLFVATNIPKAYIRVKSIYKEIPTSQKCPNIDTLDWSKKLNNCLKVNIKNMCRFCNETFEFESVLKRHQEFSCKKKFRMKRILRKY